jgi:hypothetical protein
MIDKSKSKKIPQGMNQDSELMRFGHTVTLRNNY